jgi:hypothetical protein
MYLLCVADTEDGNSRSRGEAGGQQPQYQYEPQGRFASPFKRYLLFTLCSTSIAAFKRYFFPCVVPVSLAAFKRYFLVFTLCNTSIADPLSYVFKFFLSRVLSI